MFQNPSQASTTAGDVANLSRAISIIMLVVYAFYLIFMLYTHSYLYQPAKPGVAPRDVSPLRGPVTLAADVAYRLACVQVLATIPGPQPPATGVFRIPSLPSWGSSA